MKMKLFWLILVLSVSFAASVVIDCEFISWFSTDYQCFLIKDPMITERGTVVTEATGRHLDSRNHSSVTAFWSRNSSYTVNYMPRGLNDVFPNLDAITIKNSHLKEIRQTDLQPFSKLKVLDLDKNDIETIERDLFKFNLQLQVIFLTDNKIRRVHPNVFDHLNKLRYLDMGYNACVNEYAADRAGVLELITKIKEHCNE
jgi:Leucine-rich repeat (LRR) protein